MSDDETGQRDRLGEWLARLTVAASGVTVLLAALGLSRWAAGHPVWAPGWIATTGLLAAGQILAQVKIRQLRRPSSSAAASWLP